MRAGSFFVSRERLLQRKHLLYPFFSIQTPAECMLRRTTDDAGRVFHARAGTQGGVRVCAALNGGVLPAQARGQVLKDGLIHIADWYDSVR